ncbi:MAG TPA: T9SS type B sorting domain-containing protein [Saprospiraceae bacterium]|nr:T9SS type B sorting domain-containing protein [Saprospiraceae bacterium]
MTNRVAFSVFMLMLLFFVSVPSYAQKPTAIKIDGKMSTQGSPETCADQTPGHVTFSNFNGQSNDIWGDPATDTIYLCYNDLFNLSISGQDLSGDPDMTTSAGVGYGFYKNKPIIPGPDLVSVVQDDHYFDFSGTDYLLSTGCDTSGAQTFENTGILQGLLNGGAPICIWFAPITYDNLDPPSPTACKATYENGGPCVKVGIDESFPVVYLNAIQADNINNNDGGGCRGSFRVLGGLPEYNANTHYDIEISMVSDPTKKAYLLGNHYTDGQLVQFEVGEGGTYGIHISDGKSCDYYGTVDMPGCNSIGIDMIDTSAAKGSSVCIPVSVRDFNGIAALEFAFYWDSTVVAFDKIMDPGVLGVNGNNVTVNLVDSAHLVLSWSDLGGVTLADGTVILEICFKLNGPWGSSTPIWIGPNVNGNGISISGTSLELYALDYASHKGSITILNPNAMTINLDSTDVVCKGESTGSFSANVLGGGGFPVTMDWQEVGGTPSGSETLTTSGQNITVTDLPAGTYNLHFTDSVGAVQDTSIIIEDGYQLGANLPPVNTLCNGDTMHICPIVSKDFVTINDLSGYSFLWENGSSDMCRDTIPAGFFAITVTDPAGCVATSSATLTQPSSIVLNPLVTEPTCVGVNTGQIEITPTGGTTTPMVGGDYNFNWDNTGFTTNISSTLSGLGQGTHYIRVTDDNNCEVTDSFTLVYQKTLNLSGTGQDISCAGSDDGQIGAEVSSVGGTQALPYSYAWNPNVTSVTQPTADSVKATLLAPGLYEITVTDGDGCTDSTSVVLSEPDSIIITLDSIHHESCTTGADGFIAISATGGAGGYSYAWDNGPTVPVNAGIVAASYTVTVTDANGCSKEATYTVLPPTPPVITGFTKVNVNCPTDNNGSLTPMVTNGNGTLILYSWGNGSTASNVTGLSSGVNCLTVTDEYGCQAMACDTIVSTQGFYILDTKYFKPQCPGMSNGSILVTMSNQDTFDFAWDYDNTNHTNILSNIPAGNYNVTITDLNSTCPPLNASFTLQDTHSIVTNIQLLNGVSCFDGSATDGSANVTAIYSDSTTNTFDFSWQGGYMCQATTSCTATNLAMGPVIVTVDDGTCIVQDTVMIPAPDSIKVTTAITNTTCYGDSDGSIFAIGSGGTLISSLDYSYGWSPSGQTGPNLTNAPAGNYDLLVTDDVGCSELFHLVINEPDSLEVLIDLTKTVDVYCYGDSTGQIYVQPIGGNANTGYTYAWSPNVSDSNVASLLTAGTYQVTVSDGLGCTQELTHVLSQNDPISATLSPIVEPECFGYQTLISIDTVIGGSGGPYSFSVDFSPPKSIQLDFPVFAGPHVVRVLDAYECSSEYNVDIAEPDEIYVNLPESITVELGDSIQLNPVISSSLPIDSFYWSPVMYLMPDSVLHPQVVGLTYDQVYELVVVDANGCTKEASTLVEVDRNRNVYIPNIFSPNNDGFNDVFFPKTGIGVKQVNFMNVYDRWGEIIYEAKEFLPRDNSTQSWDGTYKGKAMNPGVYIYLIEVEFMDGVKLLYRGDVTLLR